MKICYTGFQPNASGFGWATANFNLVRELIKLVELCDVITHSTKPADVCFIPIADHDLNPVSPVKGKINLGYTFFEFPLGPNAVENAKQYDVIFAGSTWCLDRLAEKGIHNTELLIQGVDQNIFKPQPPRKYDGQFRIFSGGKFEYRKGQDLVIAAFRKFCRAREDAHLICSWFNPWPALIRSMSHLLEIPESFPRMPQAAAFESILNYADIDDGFFAILPQLSQSDLAREMANTDVGLFPNRCEGGTNLVLMEYASIGRKIIANAKTGHADVESVISYEIPATTDENHWAVQSVDDIVAMLELAYQNRELSEHWSTEVKPRWTWAAAAEKIVAAALAIGARK